MAVTISNAYVETFENNVRHLAQQTQTRLRGCVQVKSNASEKHNWERMGTSAATLKASVLTPTPVSELSWSRRVSLAETWHDGDAVEQEDPVQMLVDPNSNLTRALSMSMNRGVDDIIIKAATGDALNGSGGNDVFPVAQEIGNYTGEIDFDMVTQVQERFMENDITPDIPKFMIIGPKQIRKLMNTTQQTSSDYVRRGLDELSATGIVPNWMGFTWIMSTRLLAPAGAQIDCLAFTKDALGMSINRDITARIAEDPTVSFAWRVYTHMTLGAVRVEDEQIVRLKLADTVT